MRFDFRVPQPPLDRFVRMIWCWRNPGVAHPMERLMPNGEAALIVNLKVDVVRVYRADTLALERSASGAVLIGPHSQPSIIASGEQEDVLGVQFRPGGAFAFFGAPLSEFANEEIDLDDTGEPRTAGTLRERLLAARTPDARLDVAERFLLDRWRGEIVHPAVGAAIQAIDRCPNARTGALAAALGLSERRLIELFKRQVGFPPKTLARLRRFQRAIHRAHGLNVRTADWTRIAQDCGYYDQAHFNHDFRTLAGLTPTAYLFNATRHPNHVSIAATELPAKLH